MYMYACGEILTTLFTGLGYARSVSEHTYILMIDTMYTVPYYFKQGTENIDNQLFVGDFGINFAKKKIPTELCMYSF